MANPCAAGLVPDTILFNSSQTLKFTWLSLINASNYEQVKNMGKESDGGSLFGLVTGGHDMEYDEFNVRRNAFLQQNSGAIDSTSTSSVMSQSVPESARIKFFDCVKNTAGLQAWFEEESDESITAILHYTANARLEINYAIDLLGGTANKSSSLEGKLKGGDSTALIVKRDGLGSNIHLVVNGDGESSHFLSVAPIRLKQIEAFARTASNLNGVMEVDFGNPLAGYGTNFLGDEYDNGGIVAPKGGPRFAEWSLPMPIAGDYFMSARYAAKESRPLDVSINGVIAIGAACSQTTGSWFEPSRQTFLLGRVRFNEGNNIVRLSAQYFGESFPHLHQLIFSPTIS